MTILNPPRIEEHPDVEVLELEGLVFRSARAADSLPQPGRPRPSATSADSRPIALAAHKTKSIRYKARLNPMSSSAGPWACDMCTFVHDGNRASLRKCAVCSAPRPPRAHEAHLTTRRHAGGELECSDPLSSCSCPASPCPPARHPEAAMRRGEAECTHS